MPAQHGLRFEDHDHLIETLAGACFRLFEFVGYRRQHHSFWIGYPRRCLRLALQDAYLLSQDGNLQILVPICHLDDRQEIERQRQEQC
jgi:hypothetical protein